MMALAMDVLDAAGTTAIDARVLARRPAGLTGATIGILDNSKPNARVLLERVAKGLRERFIFLRHILRNSLLPTVTILGLNVGYLVGGAVVIERVFAIPGMGGLMLDAIFGRDYAVVQGVTFFFASMVIFINLLTDLTYSFLDPRVTLE